MCIHTHIIYPPEPIINYSTTKFSDENSLINEYKFFDASISYKKNKDSKWEFEIKANNLLDTKSQLG